jgi:hypothetical protein
MPTLEPQRSSEAVRRLLSDLIRLDRYERRAVSRRDRAIRQITKRSSDFNHRLQISKYQPASLLPGPTARLRTDLYTLFKAVKWQNEAKITEIFQR